MLKQEDTYTLLVEVNQAIYAWSLRHGDESKSVLYSLKYMTHPLNLMGIKYKPKVYNISHYKSDTITMSVGEK